MTAVIADLETIWAHVLETHFNITKPDLKTYKAVLIIPDVYNRKYLRELTTLLLTKIGFGSCFLVQVKKKKQKKHLSFLFYLRHFCFICVAFVFRITLLPRLVPV